MNKTIITKKSLWDFVFSKNNAHEELNADHLHPEANSIRGSLEQIFKELGQETELIPHAKEVIHPLLKEVEYLQSSLKVKTCPVILTKYTQWTKKAAKWVDTYANTGKEEALIHHIVEKSHALIDRDMNLIVKYMETHKLDPLAMSQLDSELQTLASLRKKPTNLSLKKITSWKSDLNNVRAKIVNAALQKIDSLKTKLK